MGGGRYNKTWRKAKKDYIMTLFFVCPSKIRALILTAWPLKSTISFFLFNPVCAVYFNRGSYKDKPNVISKFLRIKGELFSSGNKASRYQLYFSLIGFNVPPLIKKTKDKVYWRSKFRFVINRYFSQFFSVNPSIQQSYQIKMFTTRKSDKG